MERAPSEAMLAALDLESTGLEPISNRRKVMNFFIPILAQGLPGAPIDPRYSAISIGAVVILAVLGVVIAAALQKKP